LSGQTLEINDSFEASIRNFYVVLTPKKCLAGTRNMIGARIKNLDPKKNGALMKTRAEINIGARTKTVARTKTGTRKRMNLQ